MGFGKEIKRLRDDVNMSAGKFASIIEIDADRLRKWEQKDLNPRDEDTAIIEQFFGMPLDKIEKLTSIKKFLNVPREPYREVLKNKKNGLIAFEKPGIPIYDIPIDASFLERYREDGEGFEPIGFLNIPKLRNFNFAAIISGNSMWPLMKSGSIAACRIVERMDYFDEGEMYFVSTINGFETVKYVQSGDNNDELKLIPHNEKIKPSIIKKDMVIRMCIVEAWLNFR